MSETALRRPAATAHDVARAAGVSQSAVSRAFTDGASVSPAMREKVMAAAGRLGYRPNRIARSLITRRSGIVGVAVAYLDNQFYPAVLEALSAELASAGLRALLFTPPLGRNADPILEEVLQYRVDALVLVSADLSSHFAEQCEAAGVPVVLLNRKTQAASVSSVTGDNFEGGARIADFLLAGGHRRPAFLAGLESSSTSRDRGAGFTRRLAERGAGAPLHAVGDYDFATARRAAAALLAGDERPDAIFCANDHMALAAIDVARADLGLQVGREVSVVGFDDVGPAGWSSFSLTTFTQPVAEMAARVVDVLRADLAGEAAGPVQLVTPGELVVRGSARRPAQGCVVLDGRTVWRG